ncbi:DUF2007 domain-containing protein [candidate division WOR-3 bacterium]|nr:DUF2007 domain-containing protein [candidate division WOR-3 bacterium]
MKNDLVILETYFNETDAELAFSLLKSSGIEVFIRRDDFGGLGPHLTFARGIKLLVRNEDEEEARQLLSVFNNSNT